MCLYLYLSLLVALLLGKRHYKKKWLRLISCQGDGNCSPR